MSIREIVAVCVLPQAISFRYSNGGNHRLQLPLIPPSPGSSLVPVPKQNSQTALSGRSDIISVSRDSRVPSRLFTILMTFLSGISDDISAIASGTYLLTRLFTELIEF